MSATRVSPGTSNSLLILVRFVFSLLLLVAISCSPALSQSNSSWEATINQVMGMKGEQMRNGVLRFDLREVICTYQ